MGKLFNSTYATNEDKAAIINVLGLMCKEKQMGLDIFEELFRLPQSTEKDKANILCRDNISLNDVEEFAKWLNPHGH